MLHVGLFDEIVNVRGCSITWWPLFNDIVNSAACICMNAAAAITLQAVSVYPSDPMQIDLVLAASASNCHPDLSSHGGGYSVTLSCPDLDEATGSNRN